MKDRYFHIKDINNTITVEFGTRKFLLSMIDQYMDQIRFVEDLRKNDPDEYSRMGRNFYLDEDTMISILYKDGSEDIIDCECDGCKKIKRINIDSIVYADAYQVLVFGNFEMNECGCVTTSHDEIIDDTNIIEVDSADYHQQVETPVGDPAEEIPEAVMNEIDYMLGSTEECNSEPLVSILKDHGIDPNGGWLFIESVPDEVIQDINEKLFETGLIVPFVWEEGE